MNKLFRALTSVLIATHFAGDASADPKTIELPGETAKLKESTLPGYSVATQKCLICHSVDYISFQPPGMTQKQWTAEMLKMQHLYGAPIDDQEIKVLATYLATMYGDATSVSAD
jgi:cytochrome c